MFQNAHKRDWARIKRKALALVRSGLDLANSRKYEFVNLLNVAFIFLQINLIIALASPAYFPGAHFATSK